MEIVPFTCVFYKKLMKIFFKYFLPLSKHKLKKILYTIYPGSGQLTINVCHRMEEYVSFFIILKISLDKESYLFLI